MNINIKDSLKGVNNVILAYSGGVDSQALIDLLKKVENINIVAVHVNHNINEKSKEWEEFCQLESDNVTVISKSIFLSETGNLENEARKARYDIFHNEYCKYDKKDTILMTGHHMNDQAETFLLKLARGSGINGLSGIRYSSEFLGMTIVRPLLKIKKDEIYRYAKSNKLSWIEDPSNKSLEYDRNFIRNKVLPILEERWPNIVNMISKSSNFIEEAKKLQDESILQNYSKEDCGGIDARKIYNTNALLKNSIVRHWLHEEIGMAPDEHFVKSIVEQCINKTPHNSGKIIKKYFVVEKKQHIVRVLPREK